MNLLFRMIVSLVFMVFALEVHAFRYSVYLNKNETEIREKDSNAIYEIAQKYNASKFYIRSSTPMAKVKGPLIQERYALIKAMNIRKILISAGVPLDNIEIVVKRGDSKYPNRVLIDVTN